MDILDDMGVSKLSAKVFSKVNYSFNILLQMSACFSHNIFIKLGLSLTICTIICIYLIKI